MRGDGGLVPLPALVVARPVLTVVRATRAADARFGGVPRRMVRKRICRRAHALALRAYVEYRDAMQAAILSGAWTADDILFWTPASGARECACVTLTAQQAEKP